MTAKRKGCRREVGSEGSVEQRREPMGKNRIRRIRRTSGQLIAQSISSMTLVVNLAVAR